MCLGILLVYINKLGQIYEVITTSQDYLMEKFFDSSLLRLATTVDTEDILACTDEETRKGSRLLKPVVVKRFASHVISGVVNDLVTQ